MGNFKYAFCLMSLSLVLGACGGSGSSTTPPTDTTPAPIQDTPQPTPPESGKGGEGFTVLHSGQYIYSGAFTEGATDTYRAQSDYEERLTEYSNDDPVAVDFSQNTVVLVDMGQKSSGGYSIEVSKVEFRDELAVVSVLSKSPGNNCVVTAALTNPYQIVSIPTQKIIVFVEESQTNDC